MTWPKGYGILEERTGSLTENTDKKKALFKIGQSSFTSPGTRHAVSRRLKSKHSSAFIVRTLGLLDPEDENNCETCEASEALRPTTRRHSQEDPNIQERRFENLQCRIYPLNAKLNPIYHLLTLLGAHRILHVSRIRVNEGYCLLVCNIVQMKPAGSSETSVHIYQTTRRHISEDSYLTAIRTSYLIM